MSAEGRLQAEGLDSDVKQTSQAVFEACTIFLFAILLELAVDSANILEGTAAIKGMIAALTSNTHRRFSGFLVESATASQAVLSGMPVTEHRTPEREVHNASK